MRRLRVPWLSRDGMRSDVVVNNMMGKLKGVFIILSFVCFRLHLTY